MYPTELRYLHQSPKRLATLITHSIFNILSNLASSKKWD